MEHPAPGSAYRSLSWSVEDALPNLIVDLSGTLDLSSAPIMRDALVKALSAQPTAIVVDLSRLHVVEEACLLTLSVAAREAAAWPGCQLLVCGADRGVESALRRLGIGRYVKVVPSRAQATRLLSEGSPVRLYRERLLPVPSAISVGRRMCAAICAEWGVPEFTQRAGVVVTELISNVVKHARTPMTVTMTAGERHLHLAVRDADPTPPARVAATETGGRGLLLVEAFSSSWGTAPTGEGKVVWAVLRR